MRTRSLPLLGLLVAVALLASAPLHPASAQCHTRCGFNVHTQCFDCVFNIIFTKECNLIDCDNCGVITCTANQPGSVAQGTVLPESSLQCSLGDVAWSRLALPTDRWQVQVVKPKARS